MMAKLWCLRWDRRQSVDPIFASPRMRISSNIIAASFSLCGRNMSNKFVFGPCTWVQVAQFRPISPLLVPFDTIHCWVRSTFSHDIFTHVHNCIFNIKNGSSVSSPGAFTACLFTSFTGSVRGESEVLGTNIVRRE